MALEILEINLSSNYCLNWGQFLLVPSLNVNLYYGVNSDSKDIFDRSLDTNFPKQTLPEGVYVIVYIPA